MVPNVIVDVNTININGNNVTLILSWGEPFNNLDPIVNYTVSCDVACPPNFTTTDNTARSHTITNLTPMTDYTFSVVATNSIGSGEAGVVRIITPGKLGYMHIHRVYFNYSNPNFKYIYTYVYICNYIALYMKCYSYVIHNDILELL